jgi:hypothetical protein
MSENLKSTASSCFLWGYTCSDTVYPHPYSVNHAYLHDPLIHLGPICSLYDWLVVWNMFGNVIIPTDELHHFSEGWLNHQPVIDFSKALHQPSSTAGRKKRFRQPSTVAVFWKAVPGRRWIASDVQHVQPTNLRPTIGQKAVQVKRCIM